MKPLMALFSILFISHLLTAQDIPEIKVESKVNEVTVFLNGAQITRHHQVSLPGGESIIIFTGLSPFINPESIRVNASGNIIVLSVDHNQNYLDKSKKNKKYTGLTDAYNNLQDRIDRQKAYLGIIKEQIDLLNKNKKIAGANNNLTVDQLKSITEYYAGKLTSLTLDQLKKQKELKQLQAQQDTLFKQIKEVSGKKVFPTGEISIKVFSENPTTASFTLTYNVNNARWFPVYDIRSNQTDEPLNIGYKARIKQNTKVDWEHVKLSLSSSDPDIPGDLPKLIPYHLGGNQLKNTHIASFSREVSGTVTDESGPLPGVNISVKGSTIGTTTDFDGNYKLLLPEQQVTLVFSFVGYKDVEIIWQGQSEINVNMEQADPILQEVVITAIGRRLSDNREEEDFLTGYKRPEKKNKNRLIKQEAAESIEIPLERYEKQTSVNFDIKTPYTIPSNGQVKTIELTRYEIPVKYEYLIIPKITSHAYLLSYITDWEQYNLLSGEAHVFIQGTSIGKTLLDTGYAQDTLQISLGIDKGISVKRELGKKFSGTKFIGSKRTDTREWRISVKNNKNKKVRIKLTDQVPVSVSSEIEVEIVETSGGHLNKDTGEVNWIFNLSPGKSKEFSLKYRVKYPRYKNLDIE